MKRIVLSCSLVLLLSAQLRAQYCNYICNGGFDSTNLGSTVGLVTSSQLKCWQTTSSDGKMEIWANGYQGIPSWSGIHFLEMNATMANTLYQNTIASPGTILIIKFAHRGRSGMDTMSVSAGPVGGPYTVLGYFGDDNTAWGYHTVYYLVPNSGYNYSIRFNTVSQSGGHAAIGNFLDAVSVCDSVKPVINNTISGIQFGCEGTVTPAISGSVPVGGSGNYTFFWISSVTGPATGFIQAIGPINGRDYEPGPSYKLYQTTWFRRIVTSAGVVDTSAAVMISIESHSAFRTGFTINNPAQCLSGNKFIFTDTTAVSSGVLERKWYFGNGDSSGTIIDSVTYDSISTYTVKLFVKSNMGCLDSISKTVLVFPAPVADFTINDDEQCLNENHFVFTDISNVGTGTYTRSWHMGDGGLAGTSSVSWNYSAAGTYPVKLAVTLTPGCADSITRLITVHPSPSVVQIFGESLVNVDSTSSFHISGQAGISYAWFTDKGNIISGQGTDSIKVDWSSKGDERLRLLSTNQFGCTDTSFLDVKIVEIIRDDEILRLYPNPNDGHFAVEIFASSDKEVTFALYDMLGQIVFNETRLLKKGLHRIELYAQLSSAIYFLDVKFAGKSKVFHMAVTH